MLPISDNFCKEGDIAGASWFSKLLLPMLNRFMLLPILEVLVAWDTRGELLSGPLDLVLKLMV